jgi:phosphoglycerol transferase
MRIAVQNAFPNRPQSAEAEWFPRFFIACGRLGFEPVEVITSDDIIRCQPDCVLVTHEASPKLTPFPTLGMHWNPPDFFADDPARRRSVLSLDGHLCGSRQIAQWIDDFTAGHGKRAVLHDGLMLPSTPDSGPANDLPRQLAIMYAGVHWDGSRHGAVFRGLDGRVPLQLYGPPESWAGRGKSYKGTLPFDGVSVIKAIRAAGIALCLHKAAHREANCPTMRLFEAAAAGALIITDDFEFPREWFRDSVLYVDAELPAPMVVEQIVSHVEWANRNPDAANRLARRSNDLFRRRLCLESMLSSIPAFVDRVRDRRCMMVVNNSPEKHLPTVEYIIRIGSRPVATLARALDSLAAQTYQAIAIILVQFHPVAGLDEVVDRYRSRFRWIRHIVVANNGSRSTAWWAGLNAVSADFFAMLDDDDTLFPNHAASLMDRFEREPACGFVYSGLIKVEDEPGHYVTAPQFSGPAGKTIEERREIFCLEEEDFENLSPTHNVIGNHAWICRSSLLDREILTDPQIQVAEDVYFMALMAGRTRFGFTAMATAVWHWRSTTRDNWTLSHPQDRWPANLARWQERLQSIKLPSHNRVSRPASQYDLNRAMDRDSS